ncbi:hypothetical protein D3C76_1691180 [compost metagenome]
MYAFEQQDAEGIVSSYWVDVTADPFEGEVGEKTELSFTQELTDVSGTMDTAEQNTGMDSKGKEGQVPVSLMWIAAAVALVIMLLEWGVYQRGRSI